jgi:hypothetical protein
MQHAKTLLTQHPGHRRTTRRLCLALAVTSTLAPPAAFGARPMITDDARIVDAKSCQVESWVRTNQGSREYWALPGCNFTGNLEITLGGALTKTGEGRETSDVVIQGKTLFKTLQPNGWPVGLAVGNVQHPHQHSGLAGDLYAYVPASFSFADDRVVLHTNAGVLRQKASGQTRLTLGLGSETQIASNTWLIAESFKQLDGRPFFQAGVRHWIVPNCVQIDATYGNRLGSGNEERWFSFGLRLLSPAFLP